MKRSSTRSGPSCSGFWDTVRNNLTIREMTALMGGDSTMEQQTEKDFRFENDPQAEVFLLSEKTKEKAPSISAWCSLWCTSRTHIRTFLRFHGFPESDRFCTFLIVKGNKYLIIVEIDGIDEGVHQCLPLLRLGHVQLAEAEQPEPDELFFHLRLGKPFLCNAGLQFFSLFFQSFQPFLGRAGQNAHLDGIQHIGDADFCFFQLLFIDG